MDVRERRKGALPGRADGANALPPPDMIPCPNRDLREVTVDRAKAVWLVIDHDDQPAQVAVVPGDRHAPIRRGDHVASR